MMKTITASKLAIGAFGMQAATTTATHAPSCAACGTALNGKGVPITIERSFNDAFQFADRHGRTVCGDCRALMLSDAVSKGPTGSGVVSASGFTRLLSNKERVAFLVKPPTPPFAVAIVNAQRQHVWWMARVAYSKDLIPVQFGHRPLIIDRKLAIATADAVLDYEASTTDEKGKGTIFPLRPISRDLRSPLDGQYTHRFTEDGGNHARALRADLAKLSLGDMWAMFQARSAARELKVATVAEAGRVAAGILDNERKAKAA